MNNMKDILAKLETVTAANKAGKNALIKDYMQDSAFKRFLIYCLDESLTFNVSRVAMTVPIHGDFYELLDALNKQGSATKAQKEQLAGLGSQSPEHLLVLNKILRKNPDCGFSAKSLHKIMPGEIPYYPYQRCSTDAELGRIFDRPVAGGGISYAFSELKENGLFVRHLVPAAGRPYFQSRNGKSFDFGTRFDLILASMDPGMLADVDDLDYKIFNSGIVLEGEALVMNEDGTDFLPRALGNAIVNKFQGGYGSPEELARIRFSVWTVLPLHHWQDGHSPLTVETRRECLAILLDRAAQVGLYRQTEGRQIFSDEEAWNHYFEIRERPVPEGEEPLEGTVVKHPDEVWSDGTSLFMAKCKSIRAAEVEIYGWQHGKPGGKNEHRLGAFLIRSSCGGLIGKCSGMSDAIRDGDNLDGYIGKIAEVHFNAVSKSKDPKKPCSFDHCRFIEIRNDKNQADTLEYILKVKEMKR